MLRPGSQASEKGLWGGENSANTGGRRRQEAAWGPSGKIEKDGAKPDCFNLINDCTPLRVCFNNQDTLQQVDRMFAVNLHMSSEQAVNINNAGFRMLTGS